MKMNQSDYVLLEVDSYLDLGVYWGRTLRKALFIAKRNARTHDRKVIITLKKFGSVRLVVGKSSSVGPESMTYVLKRIQDGFREIEI